MAAPGLQDSHSARHLRRTGKVRSHYGDALLPWGGMLFYRLADTVGVGVGVGVYTGIAGHV